VGPQFFQRPNRCEVLFNIRWLDQISRDLLVIGASDIYIPAAAAYDYHRGSPQHWISLPRFENLIAIHFRKTQEYKIGPWSVDVIPFALHERKSFHTIGNNMDLARASRVTKSRERYVNIRRIVLNKKYCSWSVAHRLGPHSSSRWRLESVYGRKCFRLFSRSPVSFH